MAIFDTTDSNDYRVFTFTSEDGKISLDSYYGD